MTYIICTITYVVTWQHTSVSLGFTPPRMVESTALIYLMGFRDNAGLRSGKVFCFRIQISIHYIHTHTYKVIHNGYGLLLEIDYVTSYNSMPTSPHSQS